MCWPLLCCMHLECPLKTTTPASSKYIRYDRCRANGRCRAVVLYHIVEKFSRLLRPHWSATHLASPALRARSGTTRMPRLMASSDPHAAPCARNMGRNALVHLMESKSSGSTRAPRRMRTIAPHTHIASRASQMGHRPPSQVQVKVHQARSTSSFTKQSPIP